MRFRTKFIGTKFSYEIYCKHQNFRKAQRFDVVNIEPYSWNSKRFQGYASTLQVV